MKLTAIEVLGKEAERMKEVWGLDEEGETKGMWRDSGHRESEVTWRFVYLLTSSNIWQRASMQLEGTLHYPVSSQRNLLLGLKRS
jgi:hypothetical protein